MKLTYQGHSWDLEEKDTWTIGRSPTADIQFLNPKVSRSHCRLIKKDGKWFVIDQPSVNGTFLESENRLDQTRVIFEPQELKPGNRLKLADAIDLEIETI